MQESTQRRRREFIFKALPLPNCLRIGAGLVKAIASDMTVLDRRWPPYRQLTIYTHWRISLFSKRPCPKPGINSSADNSTHFLRLVSEIGVNYEVADQSVVMCSGLYCAGSGAGNILPPS